MDPKRFVAACSSLALAVAALAQESTGSAAVADAEAKEPAPRLADAPQLEQQTLKRMLEGGSWARRALGAMRLERFVCPHSQAMLTKLLDDPDWQVRAFALRALGRRRVPACDGWLTTEEHPLVLRAALRYRYPVNLERLGRGVRYLARSRSLEDKMLAVELGIASGEDELVELATQTVRTIILRMGRAEAGSLSPRLAVLTGQPDVRRFYAWRRWLRRMGRRFSLRPAYAVAESAEAQIELGRLATMHPKEFAALERYIEELSGRSVDLAICLDCTASMSGELAEAQGGIDDLMIFVGDVVSTLRVALVAYRDRRDEFETRAWHFTDDIEEARRHLWSLTATGGGDTPEAVYPALRLAYGRLTWQPEHVRVLVLVGDAPPHVGYGALCVRLAERAHRAQVTTHVIDVERKPVKHFAEIAEAGGGRCVSLGSEGTDSLIIEIAGLTLGERFGPELREFFRTYLELCR